MATSIALLTFWGKAQMDERDRMMEAPRRGKWRQPSRLISAGNRILRKRCPKSAIGL